MNELDWLPKHAAGLTLQHNDHKSVYDSVEQWIEKNTLFDFISEGEKQKAIATDSIWTLQWYPHTPIGFYSIAASSLAALEAHMKTLPEELQR